MITCIPKHLMVQIGGDNVFPVGKLSRDFLFEGFLYISKEHQLKVAAEIKT